MNESSLPLSTRFFEMAENCLQYCRTSEVLARLLFLHVSEKHLEFICWASIILSSLSYEPRLGILL